MTRFCHRCPASFYAANRRIASSGLSKAASSSFPSRLRFTTAAVHNAWSRVFLVPTNRPKRKRCRHSNSESLPLHEGSSAVFRLELVSLVVGTGFLKRSLVIVQHDASPALRARAARLQRARIARRGREAVAAHSAALGIPPLVIFLRRMTGRTGGRLRFQIDVEVRFGEAVAVAEAGR